MLYLCLVILTTLAVDLFIFNEISNSFGPQLAGSLHQSGRQNMAQAYQSGFRLRILLLLSAGLLTIVFFSVVWLRLVTHFFSRPIHAVHNAVQRLAQGNLNETVSIENGGIFGQIASSLNELAANLQELLIYIWKQSGQCITLIEEIKSSPGGKAHESFSQIEEQLQQLTEAVHSLRQMARAYVFYDVRLDGEKAVAVNHPGEKVTDSPI